LFYVFSGGIYNSVVENVRPYGIRQDESIQLIYWDDGDVSKQYEWEGYAAAILIYLGTLGFFLLKKATEEPHNINRAMMYQFLGIALIFFAFLILQYMFNYKSSKRPPY
jgi:hypothetical protein